MGFGSRGTFVSDTSPKYIDREGLGRRRTGNRQGLTLIVVVVFFSSSLTLQFPLLSKFSSSCHLNSDTLLLHCSYSFLVLSTLVFLSLSLAWLDISSVSTIMEEEDEDPYSSDTSGQLSPGTHTPSLKLAQVQNPDSNLPWTCYFPTPETFHQFLQNPHATPPTERKSSPKYVFYLIPLLLEDLLLLTSFIFFLFLWCLPGWWIPFSF